MTTGERMKKRRKEIGLSAEKVAELLGVSPSTVYRYENGDIENMPGAILEPVSNILMTTPAYLMGWEDSSSSCNLVDDAATVYSVLTEQEQQFINNYRAIPENLQKYFFDMLASAAQDAKKSLPADTDSAAG